MSLPKLPLPYDTSKMAPKVKWSALASLVVTAVLTTIAGAVAGGDIVQGVPDPLTGLVLGLLTSAGTALAGYAAPHQDRLPPAPGDDTATDGAGPSNWEGGPA